MEHKQRTIRSAYGPKQRQQIKFASQGRTKQAMQAECDINNIMAKYQKTGVIDFVNKHQPQYGDASGVDFQSAMQTVKRAEAMFADLPSTVRKRFNNNPSELLQFCENPENRQEAIKLGLLDKTHGREADTSSPGKKRREGDSEAPKEPPKAEQPKA